VGSRSRPAGPVPHLRVFGGVELLAATAEPLAKLVTQTKPLALLAYLVMAEPRGYHRRDRLLGLFWPELDDQHARGALRKALHALRRGLGDGVVDARGDEEVGIAPATLACDALAFDEAIEAGRTARALELYRGDLLPGFFVREATEFQQWLDHTRVRYQKQAATAAWVLAERSELEERATAAGEWARRAAMLSPFDERVVRKALALLGRVGDRAGAVALYESFRERLAREYDVEPARETMTLIRQIRDR
jgi:DNA-binding SARP family transcriptional activator